MNKGTRVVGLIIGIIFLFFIIIFMNNKINDDEIKIENKIDKTEQVIIDKEGTSGTGVIYDIYALLGEEEVMSILTKEKNGNLMEEIPRIESYYTQNAFYEFYLFNALKNNDIHECDNIKELDHKNLCIDIFNNQSDKEKIIDIYKQNGEDISFSIGIYNIIGKFKDESLSCSTDNFLLYFACMKMENKEYDVMKNFINFSILERSNREYVRNEYKNILNTWGIKDKAFMKLVEKYIVGVSLEN